MPTQHPRLNVVLEEPLYRSLARLAKKEGISLSMKARDMIRIAMEFEEDLYWGKVADKREKTFGSRKALSHREVWGKHS